MCLFNCIFYLSVIIMSNRGSVQLLCVIFGFILKCAWTYRTGAPTRACGDMTPQHGSPINTDPAPFLVEVSKTQYAPNERIYGKIHLQIPCYLLSQQTYFRNEIRKYELESNRSNKKRITSLFPLLTLQYLKTKPNNN